MESYYCPHLFKEIKIDSEKVEPYDCALAIDFAKTNNIEKFKTYDNYFNNFLKFKTKTIEKFIIGKIPEQCQNCGDKQNTNINFSDYIKEKFVNKNIIDTIFMKPIDLSSNERLDYMDIFKNMIEKKLVDPAKTFIDFHNNQISDQEEIKDIIEAAYQNNIRNYSYITNAETFVPIIAEYAEKSFSRMIIPFFAGCSETYQKANNSDKFEDVKKNIIEYAKSNIEITFKYIVLENINDNISEIKKFCSTMTEIINKAGSSGGFCLLIDFDHNKVCNENYVIPKGYTEIMNYLIGWGEYKNIDVHIMYSVETDKCYNEYLNKQQEDFLTAREEYIKILIGYEGYEKAGYAAAQEYIAEWDKKYNQVCKKFTWDMPTFTQLWDAEIKKGNLCSHVKDELYNEYLNKQQEDFLTAREEYIKILIGYEGYEKAGYAAAQEYIAEWDKKYNQVCKKFTWNMPTFADLWNAEIKKGNLCKIS